MVLSGRKWPPSRKRHRAEERRDQAGENERERKSEPRRGAGRRRQPGGGIGADADEGRLSEGGEAADPGQQHDPERDQRVDADVVEQRDGERRRRRTAPRPGPLSRRMPRGGSHRALMPRSPRPPRRPAAATANASSSTGIRTLKTTTSLKRAVPERREAFQNADQDGADRGPRIADKAADDRADEGLEPDHEAGIVVERRHRADQNAR